MHLIVCQMSPKYPTFPQHQLQLIIIILCKPSMTNVASRSKGRHRSECKVLHKWTQRGKGTISLIETF